MTEILEDNVDVDLQIGTVSEGFSTGSIEPGVSEFDDDAIFWDAIELKVELTRDGVPNYVKGKTIPQKQYIDEISGVFNQDDRTDIVERDDDIRNKGVSLLVGSRFRLEVDNKFVAVETEDKDEPDTRGKVDTNEESEDSLLFDGRLANISPVGTNVYEFIAYDPGQKSFNDEQGSGSIINQKLELSGYEVNGIVQSANSSIDTSNRIYVATATDIVETILDEANIEKRKIDIQASNDGSGEDSGVFFLSFKKSVVSVKKALERIREETASEWWFDKDGTFYFGDPNELAGGVRTYNISKITDTSAGITTPPYQSIRVIGSAVASQEGKWENNSLLQDPENQRVVEANISLPKSGGSPVVELNPTELSEPTFKYINAELSTDQSVRNTVRKIADDLISQQASGTITVVGFPELQPFDGVKMPNSDKQPMGGQIYDVYKVVHKINNSDGFVTEIEVAGPNPNLRSVIDTSQNIKVSDDTFVDTGLPEIDVQSGDPFAQ